MVERPFRRCGSGLEPLPEVLKWSGVLSKVQTWSGDPPRGPELFGRPARRSVGGQETLPEV